MSIYEKMNQSWETYCLMSAVIYIEEMSKPTRHIQIKKYKDKKYDCICFHSLRLKMKDPKFVNNFFNITKGWEKRKKNRLIGKTFSVPRKEIHDGQDKFCLSPRWLNLILKEIGKIPNKYSNETAIDRINHLKQYKKIDISPIQKMNLLMENKKLAAGAFIVSMDLECRGLQSGKISLCMSEKYQDFLFFMLKVAKKWGWTHNESLSKVKVDNSIKRGINASPQYEFKIHTRGLKEIYKLAGPLMNDDKNRCVKFNIERSEKYIKDSTKNKGGKTKDKILNAIKISKNLTTTDLQFIAGVGTDVVLDHLNDLESKGLINKMRNGKRYIWNIK